MAKGHMEYYKKDLEKLKDAVKNCDIKMVVDSLDFFMAESNAHMAGLDREIQDRIKYYTRKLRQNCKCQTF